MTCNNCEAVQQANEVASYYRIGKANVKVQGCDLHVSEMFRRLNAYMGFESQSVRSETK